MFRGSRASICAVLCAVLLSGCTKNSEEDAMMKRVLETSPGTDVPVVFPSALVDQNGYRTGSDKIVIFRTAQEGDTFEVRDTKDDTVVYTGSIRKRDEDIRYGQFGSFQTTGTYYIYTETTGSSYAFAIDDTVNARLIDRALDNLSAFRTAAKDAGDGTGNEADIQTRAGILCNLLLAYEINPESYDDNGTRNESGNGIPDLLDEARIQAEALVTAIPANREEAAEAACALAHFSCVYAAFDEGQSAACLTAAKNAWDNAASYGSLTGSLDAFPAAAALYRMTGEKTYENVLSATFRREDFTGQFSEDERVFYGSVLYLFSKQPVNVAVRNTISEALSEDAKTIAKQAEEAVWFISEQDTERILSDMKRLSVANYLNYNHGYSGVLENHIHYLSGRNPQAVNYLGTETDRTYLDSGEAGIPENAEQLAGLLLLLGAS